MLEYTETVPKKEMREQVLDTMDLEREHGITIKAHPIRMEYKDCIFNLIDTPGHVDFSYEVTRALAACEGAILVVDATQGVEAQTVSNLWLALEQNLTIIPVINKIDLPEAAIEKTAGEIQEILNVKRDNIILTSAKDGTGVHNLLDAIVEKIPPPYKDKTTSLRALIFDSFYDSFRGAVPYIRVFSGEIKRGDEVKFCATEKIYEVQEVGYFRLGRIPCDKLEEGEVGYCLCGIKDIKDIKVGDTITSLPGANPLPGYRDVMPFVYAGVYPADLEEYDTLKESISKLALSDASLLYEPEVSPSLGFGFRCGFLGLLHKKIVGERLSREYGINIIMTSPGIRYKVITRKGETLYIENPTKIPDQVGRIEEPFLIIRILTPSDYIGRILKLCEGKRGIHKSLTYHTKSRVEIVYEIPLSEVIFDFYDKLKSVSSGYASLDYEFLDYRPQELVKLDTLINGKVVDAFSTIVHRDRAYATGVNITRKLKNAIPKQLFEVIIQAAIGKKVIAKTRVAPIRKDVTAKCYGGDITRKRKLIEKQKVGKKRMKRIGMVEVPQEAFA
jgi:GTP-binding protein LepA